MTNASKCKESVLRSSDVLRRNLIFVSGKGGVGKTVVSRAIARALAQGPALGSGRVLWVGFEDPTRPPGELRRISPALDELNCTGPESFEEYMRIKIAVPMLAQLFLQNRLIRYLAKAAPGVHELVLLGKVWHERTRYKHVVVDMPSTGHGLAMFQSTENFARLFQGGPIQRDAGAMLETFQSAEQTGQLIVSLPEEMPLRETQELADYFHKIFPGNAPAVLVNRCFPALPGATPPDAADSTETSAASGPVPADLVDYARKRAHLERANLAPWRERWPDLVELPFLPPTMNLPEALAKIMLERGIV